MFVCLCMYKYLKEKYFSVDLGCFVCSAIVSNCRGNHSDVLAEELVQGTFEPLY